MGTGHFFATRCKLFYYLTHRLLSVAAYRIQEAKEAGGIMYCHGHSLGALLVIPSNS